ncbi:putative F-box domain-containing protein [Seiridium cardinale]|uniref:F-box domain-containing protein n=1 Tax=Seiridium cardinale TaxID=138064 RepID=A0ABR2Y457_9PEZI
MAWLTSSSTSRKPRKLSKQPAKKSEHFQRRHQPAQDSELINQHSFVEDRCANSGPEITKHQRSQSASIVVDRSSHDESVLISDSTISTHGSHIMGSVMGPAPVNVPRNGGFGPDSYAGGNTAARKARPNSAAMGGHGPVPQPRRMPSMPPGSYAQFDNRPIMYNQMSRPSSSSSNGSSIMTRDSFEASMRSPASTRTSFGSWDSHPRRPEYGWQRPAPIKQYRRKAAQPGELFAAIPDEVLDLIMGNLRMLHMAESSFSCATCMMRDLCSVALGSKRLLKVARDALYANIQIVGSDSQTVRKRYKINHGSRMILLRRSLRSNPSIAAIVRTLKVPMQPQGMALDQYLNLVASVIMACPNFEQFHGPHQFYDHNFNRLFHALSTREKLKEMTWVVEPSSSQQHHRRPMADTDPEDLSPQQSAAFLELNMRWSHLTTLSIHCFPGAALTPVSLVSTALSTMPSLQTLHLSHLSQTSFDDTDLLSLPELKTLSLTNMPGITSSGLATFASRPASQSLKSFRLQHMDIDSLAALARVFQGLSSLESFTFVQFSIPVAPEDEVIWLFPYMVSKSLRKLHWDITGLETYANLADSILAKSIAAGGFPRLRVLRAPNDPEGLFQNLCKPVERIEKPSDKYRGRGLVATIDVRPNTPRTPTTPGKSPAKSLNAPPPFGLFEPKKASDLHQARLAAQKRLEEARKTPRFTVNVIDEDGTISENWGMAGFMGELGSQIHYHLLPDAGAADENGGLVQFADILDEKREDVQEKEGCTGRWNNYGYINYDKKSQEKWWHTERARWTEIRLS